MDSLCSLSTFLLGQLAHLVEAIHGFVLFVSNDSDDPVFPDVAWFVSFSVHVTFPDLVCTLVVAIVRPATNDKLWYN